MVVDLEKWKTEEVALGQVAKKMEADGFGLQYDPKVGILPDGLEVEGIRIRYQWVWAPVFDIDLSFDHLDDEIFFQNFVLCVVVALGGPEVLPHTIA